MCEKGDCIECQGELAEGCEAPPPPPFFSFSCDLSQIGIFWKLLACAVALCLIFSLFRVFPDDSDPGFWHRSGMVVYTDAATGLQYLGTIHGGLTPRLDANGKQVRVEHVPATDRGTGQ